MKHFSRTISPLLILFTLALCHTDASAQTPFRGTFKGSYDLPEASAKINVTATLTPVGRVIEVRWVTQDIFEGDTTPEEATTANVTGRVQGGRLTFFIPVESNPHEGTRYTATMQRSTLVVRFVLYYDPQGAYSVMPCKGCIKTNQVIRMKPQY